MTNHDWRLAGAVIPAWVCIAVLVYYLPGKNDSSFHFALATSWALCGFFLFSGLITRKRFPGFSLSLVLCALGLAAVLLRAPHIDEEFQWGENEVTEFPLWVVYLRSVLSGRAAELPSFGGQLIPGLTIGDDSGVTPSLLSAMQSSSMTHLTAVSGANCAIVTASAAGVVALAGGGRLARSLAAVGALVTFVVIVGFEPSVIRAAVMALVVILTIISGRPGVGLPILATAVMILLLSDPWLSVELGFVLSVVATGALFTLAGPLANALSRWMPLWLAVIISIPLSAQLACQPFIVLINPQLQTFGVIANVLAAPVAPLATIMGLIALILLAIVEPLGIAMLWIQWIPAQWIGQVAQVVSSLPQSSLPWLSGWPGFILSCMLSVAVVMSLLSHSPQIRILFGVIVGVTIVGIGAVTLVVSAITKTTIPQDWSIAFCDVGQGDAIFVQSDSRIALIDTGKYPEKLSECVELLSITKIDLLVLSHFDKDHVGALGEITHLVSTAIVGLPEDTADKRILTDLAQHGVAVHQGQSGLTGKLGQAQWQILWPRKQDGSSESFQKGNDGSVTLLMNFGYWDALFTGDLGKEAQEALLRTHQLSEVSVIKVSHHGSADQSPRFYEAVNADIAVFSTGTENTYGHPRQETIDLVEKFGAVSARTDIQGMILISGDENRLEVWSEH